MGCKKRIGKGIIAPGGVLLRRLLRRPVLNPKQGDGVKRQVKLLRAAFLVGAITDALAILPMLFPSLAKLLWGFEDGSGTYRFAMGYGASLMLGWTALLVWAYQKPLERKGVAALTVLVIYGLVITEIAAVLSGHIAMRRVLPTWLLQAMLLGLFTGGFHYSGLKQWRRRLA
jgi:hypothetical protein